MEKIKRLLITPGEPAGIGPDITIEIAQLSFPHELIVVADPTLLLSRAQQLSLPLTIKKWQPAEAAEAHEAGMLCCLPVPLAQPVVPGKLNIKNASYVMNTLSIAAQLCRDQITQGIVTGPVHKGIINEAGIPFLGHTEFFSQACDEAPTVMLFVVDQLKVALVTTHLPLKRVPAAITETRLLQTVEIVHHALQRQFGMAKPRLLMAGLNPHAGENGYLGKEEIDIIIPCINKLRDKKMDIIGPLPADTLFTQKYLHKADAIISLYHDQALPVVKYMGFDRAVNVTLGLPFIRTSVDHGTALELAGTSEAEAGSLKAAISLAMDLLSST